MKPCWSEGELRAYLDQALSDSEMEAVRGHLVECSDCARASATLAGRAARVSALMGALGALGASEDGVAQPVPRVLPVPRRRPIPAWPWAGAVAAVAAAVTLAFVLAPARTLPPAPPHVDMTAHALPQPDAARTETPPVRTLPAPAAHPRLAVSQRPQTKVNGEYYLALDDEPIETGVVMRVALSTGGQADVIYDSQWRPRAFRPVK